jgi:NTE family protein
MASGDKVGLVVAGGGARGAYEAGVLSVLLPVLEERGESPRVIVGTSVGAITTGFLASSAHLGAEVTARVALERWRKVKTENVMSSLVGRAPLTLLRFLGQSLSVPGVRVEALTDTKPLRTTLDAWIDFEQIRANVADGHIESASVVATAARSGRSVVFLDSSRRPPPDDEKLLYVPTQLRNEHIRASSAIPILFPPVQLDTPREAGGWYFDGGTRLNTPIKPVIDQGADRVVVIGVESLAPWPEDDDATFTPTFGAMALHLLDGALVDPLIEDVRTLAKINALTAEGASSYRTIPYILITPERRNIIGELATEVCAKHYRGLGKLRSPDIALLEQILGPQGTAHGALVSLLLFHEEFVEELISMGQADARRWLDSARGPDGPWHSGPLDKRPGIG